MTEISETCINKHSFEEFNVSEQKSAVVFYNPNLYEIFQFEIDGCIFTESGVERCDWLININGKSTSIFIELKGSDIKKAYRQLAESHKRLQLLHRPHVYWIICYSGSPRYNTSIQHLQLRARQEFKARLRVEESVYYQKL